MPRFKKKPVYIIYNPQEEKIDLFFSNSYFTKLNPEERIDFLTGSTVGWSYINKLGAAGSFSNDEALTQSLVYPSLPNYYNLYSNNVLAFGNSSLIANLSQNNGINNGEHFQIQNLYAQNIARDKIYSGGYIINANSPFFQTQIIAGLGMKTTLETIKNAQTISASPLVIFVPQSAQVSIFKNEQLIYSQYLTAGYQNINTSSFPEGSYELIVKVGANNILKRFFTKGFTLPPLQAPQFYALGGYLTNGMILNTNDYNFLPKVLRVPVLQTGLNKRISERLALSTNLLLYSRQGMIDFGPTFFLGPAFIKAAGLLGTGKNYGVYTQFSMQRKRLNFNLIATKVFYETNHEVNYFLNSLIDNNSASVSYQLSPTALLGVQANYSRSLDQPGFYGVGAYYQKQIGHYKIMNFFFNAAYNRMIYVGHSYNLSLSMNFSQGQFAGTEALLVQNQSNYSSQNNRLALPIVAQGSTVYSQQDEIGRGYALNENHTLSSTVSSFAGLYNYTGKESYISSYINYTSIQQQGNSLGYGGSLETELALNSAGVHLNGIERGNASGIIAQVLSKNAEDKNATFTLRDANNRKIAELPLNKKVFVSLPAFTDQNYTLTNHSNDYYHMKKMSKHLTLYPGNIGHFTWWVEKRIIVIGQVLSSINKKPLANAWIHAANNGVYSDEEGYFQLELSQNTLVLTVDADTALSNAFT